jgi:hypothetical protein
MSDIIREHARLIILRHLAEQTGYASNSSMLETKLAEFGIVKPRAWLHDEMRYLEEVGAIKVIEAGTVRVAALTDKGLEHVERRLIIEGVKRPSPAEA